MTYAVARRRSVANDLSTIAVVLAAFLASPAVQAQDPPARTIKMIVPIQTAGIKLD